MVLNTSHRCHESTVYDFDYNGGGVELGRDAILKLDGQTVGEARFPRAIGYGVESLGNN